MIITILDVRREKMCLSGSRKFFESHGLDWRDFVKNGIDAEKLMATNDKMALIVVESAEKCQAEKSK